MVHIKDKKAVSGHPTAAQWPAEVIAALQNATEARGENALYAAANTALDQRLTALRAAGVDVPTERAILLALRRRVQALCFQPTYLARYRKHLLRLGLHVSRKGESNAHRDVEDELASMHVFDFNKMNLYSFDVCGSCEAVALERAVRHTDHTSVAAVIKAAPLLEELPWSEVVATPELQNCPHPQHVYDEE